MKKRKRKDPIVVAVFSDIHAGSTIGLCPPRVNLDDGGYYKHSPAQSWLWANWKHFCKRAIDTADAWKAKLIVVSNGDLTEGTHHGSTQLIGGGNKTTQMKLAYDCIRPLVEYAEKVFIVRGTPTHVGPSASLEEKIADDLTNVVRQSEGVASWWHLPLDVNGTVFDFAHHGKLGMLPWTKANGAHNLAGQVIITHADRGDKIPNIIVRSHLHQYTDTYKNYDSTRLMATPGWQLATAFIHRIAPGSVADTGGFIFTCFPGGDVQDEVLRWRPDAVKPIKV